MTLPTGRTGQALAAALLLLLAAAAWQAVASPLLGLYAEGADTLAQRDALARRMAQVAAGLPDLQRAAGAAPAGSGAAPATLMDGASAAAAGAALQQAVQDMAGRAGVTLASIEALPAEPSGRYRRIAVRASVSAPWPALVRLLRSLADAQPALLVDDLQLRGPLGGGSLGGGSLGGGSSSGGGPLGGGAATDPPMDATLTVIAFQAAGRT